MSEVTYRRLTDPEDRDLVSAFYRRAADYILLETGASPDEGTTEAYFTGAEAGHDPTLDHREGLFREGRLDGIAELAFDLPHPGAATITLMILARPARGQGLGSAWLLRLTGIAAKQQVRAIYLSVLADNPRARDFWQREGFTPISASADRRSRLGSRPRDQMRLDIR